MSKRYHGILIILLFLLISICFYKADNYLDNDVTSNSTIELKGTYYINNRQVIATSFEQVISQYKTIDNLEFVGTLKQPIDENLDIIMFSNGLDVTMKVNGVTIYHTSSKGQNASIMTQDNSWIYFKTTELNNNDIITILLTPQYEDCMIDRYQTFFEEFQFGQFSNLYTDMFRKNGIHLALGVFISCGGIYLLLLSIIGFINKSSYKKTLLTYGLFILLCGTWYFMDMNTTYVSLLIPNMAIYNLLDYIALYLMIPIYLNMFTLAVKEDAHKKKIIYMKYLSLLYIIVVLTLQIMGIFSLYELQTSALFQIPLLTYSFFLLVKEIRRKRDYFQILALLSFLPSILGGLIQTAAYYIGLYPNRKIFCIGTLITMLCQVYVLFRYLQREVESKNHLLEIENGYLQNRISLMLSQIQPHFLYNALDSIRYLCKHDPDIAADTILSLAKYLRGNMDSLNQNSVISFKEEIEHTRCYLDVEKQRFQEHLHIIYDLQTMDFYLPPLSVQPIVENAVRYGTSKKEEGGTILIKSYEDKVNSYVVIQDDGPGFKPEKKEKDERSHVGLVNVKTRIQDQCQGSLILQTERSVGTTVTLVIPKKKNESSCD